MTKTNEYRGPLAGLNVIDFGHYYAGPMAGMILADQGANVIRIIQPGKRELPEPQFRSYNRNKKLLELDLKSAEGKQQALELIQQADVLVENFRPGVMQRLGLDYASVKSDNPGLVYLSLPGFSATDKDRANLQAWEGILGAAAGIYVEGNILRKPLGYSPVYTSMPICSSYGAVHGAIAVMAALIAREDKATGSVIEVPLVDAGLSSCTDRHIISILGGPFQHPNWLRAVAGSAPELPDMFKPLMYSPGDDEETQLKKLSGTMGFYSSDDRKMYFALAKPWHAERFYKELGIYDQLMEEGFVNRGGWDRSTKGNNLTGLQTGDYAQRVQQLTSNILKTKTAVEWETIMGRISVPFSMTKTRDEWLTFEPLHGAGILTQLDNGKSVITVPGRIADITGPEGALIDTAQQDAEPINLTQAQNLLKEREKKDYHFQALAKGNLLNGVKVLDLCSIVAGPNASHTLAQYGAEVIRVEPPQTFNLPVHLVCCLEVNQGKRSLILDTKTAPGRKAFEKLVRWADVVVHNRIDDIATRLGVRQDQLREINPNIISCQITALGGTHRGYLENTLGFDNTANMPSGQYAHFGTLKYPIGFGGVSADLMAGMGTALSGLLGLYQLRKTGIAGEGRSSLARASNYNQFPLMISENGSSDWGEARGQFAMGENWWARMYRCADDWIYAESTEAEAPAFAEIITGNQSADISDMETAFNQHDRAYWIDKLTNAGIACHPVISLDDIHPDNQSRLVSNEAGDETITGPLQSLRWNDHPCGLPVILPSPSWVRVGETPTYKRLTPTPRVGQHTRDILAEMGYSTEETDELVRLKVAHDYLPVLGDKNKYFFEEISK